MSPQQSRLAVTVEYNKKTMNESTGYVDDIFFIACRRHVTRYMIIVRYICCRRHADAVISRYAIFRYTYAAPTRLLRCCRERCY